MTQPNSLTQTTTQTSEPSIIQNLENHYLGELPEYETNQERASDIDSDKVMTESPQHHALNQEMAWSINTDVILIPDNVPEQFVPEQDVPEPDVPELSVSEQVFSNQSSATNTFVEPEITSTDDPPSSSNLAFQTSAPARPKNIPSPPTLFLDYIILVNVWEYIPRAEQVDSS